MLVTKQSYYNTSNQHSKLIGHLKYKNIGKAAAVGAKKEAATEAKKEEKMEMRLKETDA